MSSHHRQQTGTPDSAHTPALPPRVRAALVSCLVAALEADLMNGGVLGAVPDSGTPGLEQPKHQHQEEGE
jgi:hypothetical protein